MSKKALSLAASAALLVSVAAQATPAKTQAAEACDPCCPQCHCVNYDITIGGGYVDQHSLSEDRYTVVNENNNNGSVSVLTRNHQKHGMGQLIWGMHSNLGNGMSALFDFGYRSLGENSRRWSEVSTTTVSGNTTTTITPLNIRDKFNWNGYIFRVGLMYDFMCSFYAKALIGAGAVVTKYRFEAADADNYTFYFTDGNNTAKLVEYTTRFVPAAAIALGWRLNCHWGLELSYEHLFGGRVDEPFSYHETDITTEGRTSQSSLRREANVPRFNLVNLSVNYKY